MPVLYRTASPPAVYKADYLSLAFLVRCLCFIGTYIIPIIICVFYFLDNPQITIDTEFPIVHQGSILQFTIFGNNLAGDFTINYPEDYNGRMVQSATPVFDQTGRVTSIIYKLSLSNQANPPTEIHGLQVLFNYSVTLQQYARGITYGHGVFDYISPDSLESISAVGELRLEQSKAVDFRGELPGNEISKTVRHLTVESILNGQNNLSSLYYVQWNGVAPTFTSAKQINQFDAEFRVDIPTLNIMHTLPLVSVIESVIMCYLPTYILCSIIFGAIQKYCFGRGLVRVWRVKQYVD